MSCAAFDPLNAPVVACKSGDMDSVLHQIDDAPGIYPSSHSSDRGREAFLMATVVVNSW
jgi:hypothetical protein